MQADLGEFTRAIQLALAPAFLLSGIAALLNVMTSRLARVMDRGRSLLEAGASLSLEQEVLERRRHFTSVAITFTTVAALLVSVVVAGLFLEVMLQTSMKWLIGTMFAAAMGALVLGLAFFLREVHLAMRTVRIALPPLYLPHR